MSLFTEVDRLKEELDALRPLSPEQEARILQKFRLDWNYNSNAIEGNSLTLGETRSLLLHGLTAAGKPIRDHLDIKGHNEAVIWLEEVVRNEQPLTGHFIREMHQVLLGEPYEVRAQTPDGRSTSKTIRPGQYKTSPNNVLTATGEMFYFASPEETPAKMTDLVDWYRQETEHPTLHPVALAAEFHYRFVRIHPFDDGNGRMSRLLMNLILMRGGYPMTVIKATDRNRYLSALAEADAGDIEPFFKFVTENVVSSIHLMIRAAKGESIDETDDLDKKIALLKKQLTSREDFGKATWNFSTQNKFYNIFLKLWVDDLHYEMKRFDDLFMQNEVFADIRDTDKRGFEGLNGPNIINANEFIGDVFTNTKRLVEEISINFHWSKFRNLAIPFNQGAKLTLSFTQYEYQAEFSVFERKNNGYSHSPKKIYNSNYLSSFNIEHIHKLNHQLANQVYDFINYKINEVEPLS